MTFRAVQYLADNYSDTYAITISEAVNTLTINGRQNTSDEIDKQFYSPIVATGSRRASRDFARVVRFKYTTPMQNGRKPGSVRSVPWLRPEGWDTMNPGDVGTYKGEAIEVVSKVEEKLV